jgi:hypothetical protein
MYSIAVEQIIKTKASKVSILFKTIMILACIVSLTTIPSTYGFGVILFAILVVFTVLLFKFYNAEYEYSLVEGDLTIDKIMARSLRRRCGVFSITKASLITRQGSQDALRMEYKKLRTSRYTDNSNSEDIVVLYTMDEKNEMVRVFIQPNEKMLTAIKSVANKTAYKVEDVEKQEQ